MDKEQLLFSLFKLVRESIIRLETIKKEMTKLSWSDKLLRSKFPEAVKEAEQDVANVIDYTITTCKELKLEEKVYKRFFKILSTQLSNPYLNEEIKNKLNRVLQTNMKGKEKDVVISNSIQDKTIENVNFTFKTESTLEDDSLKGTNKLNELNCGERTTKLKSFNWYTQSYLDAANESTRKLPIHHSEVESLSDRILVFTTTDGDKEEYYGVNLFNLDTKEVEELESELMAFVLSNNIVNKEIVVIEKLDLKKDTPSIVPITTSVIVQTKCGKNNEVIKEYTLAK